MYQRCLIASISECENALTGLSSIAEINQDDKLFKKILKVHIALANLFELEKANMSPLNSYIALYDYYNQKNNKEQVLNIAKKVVDGTLQFGGTVNFSESDFFDSLENGEGTFVGSTVEKIVAEIIMIMEKSVFTNEPELQQQIARLEEYMASLTGEAY